MTTDLVPSRPRQLVAIARVTAERLLIPVHWWRLWIWLPAPVALAAVWIIADLTQ